MACYTAWNAYLAPGSSEYLEGFQHVHSKSQGLAHVVAFYLETWGRGLPDASYDGSGSNYTLAKGSEDLTRDQYDVLTLHLGCDGVHQDDIYDMESIVDRTSTFNCGLLYILVKCAALLRSRGDRYRRSPTLFLKHQSVFLSAAPSASASG